MHFRNLVCSINILLFSVVSLCATEPEIMPLTAVKPGMKGMWKTVVSGTTIENFELKVLGIAHNFVGPKRSVIICEAIDTKNMLTGPVAGMSGSPVYINGKLVGAYAYGYSWPKEQAIILVTPIEDMIELINTYPVEPPAPNHRPTIKRSNVSENRQRNEHEHSKWQLASGNENISNEMVESLLQPQPTPLFVSGVSQQTLNVFKSQLEDLGLQVMQAPMGSASPDSKFKLEPGAPVSAVLMNGDFNISATGTVTYRKNDTILAFGHPFLKYGSASIPMAGAEIITVVQSIAQSFKLSNTGPLLGSIYQDRLTSIAGKIGPLPPLTPLSIRTRNANGAERHFRGNIFEHPTLSPILTGIALMESLNSTLEAGEIQTFTIDGRIAIDGFAPIKYREIASGPKGAYSVTMEFQKKISQLYDNAFAIPRVSGIDLEIEISDHWELSYLKEVRVTSRRVRAGSTIDLVLSLYHYHKDPTFHPVSIPVPANLRSGDVLTVLIADAKEAERVDNVLDGYVSSFQDIVDNLRAGRSREAIYLKLLKDTPGLRLEGENLYDLPPSVVEQFSSPANNIARQSITATTLWETAIPLSSQFQGQYAYPITLE